MLLKDAYSFLKQQKLVHSHREFSTDFLSRRPRYYDDLICARRQPSPAALASLILRLGDVALQIKRDPDAERQVAELERLIAATLSHLRKCFVTAMPRKRPIMNAPTNLQK